MIKHRKAPKRFGAFDSIIQKVNTICRRFGAEHEGAGSWELGAASASTDPQIRSGAGFVKIVMKFANRTAGSDRRQFGSDGGKNLLHMVGQSR